MPTIKFTTNWNGKLNNNYFTTLRTHDPMRYKAGYLYDVLVGGHFFCRVKIVSIKTMRLRDVTEFDARLDSGFSREGFIKMIKKIYGRRIPLSNDQLFDFVLFEKLDSQSSLNL